MSPEVVDRKYLIGAQRKGAKSAQRIVQEMHLDQGQSQPERPPWEIPTPVSLRREAQEKAHQKAQRPAERPRPALARRQPTVEEIEAAKTLVPPPIRTVAEQREWRRRDRYPVGTLYVDQRDGMRCSCSSSRPCQVHLLRQHQGPYVRRAG